jgi:hypothetical protein
MTHHAYVDESQRPRRYLLTAALVPTTRLDEVSRQVRGLVPRGSRRTHLSSERASSRRTILDAYARLPITVVVASAPYSGGNDQVPRDACLRTLLTAFSEHEVGVLVLDTRQYARDLQDRRTIADAIRTGEAPSNLHYEHRGSSDEVLLSIPDAIGWAVGAGAPWRRHLNPLDLRTLPAT